MVGLTKARPKALQMRWVQHTRQWGKRNQSLLYSLNVQYSKEWKARSYSALMDDKTWNLVKPYLCTRVGQYYNKSRISPNKCLQYQYHIYFSFTILSPRQYLSHCAILITPNNNVPCYCILCRLRGWWILYFLSHKISFSLLLLPKINCLRTILCYHNVDLSPSNHIVMTSNFICNVAIIALHDLCNNRLQKI